jgi:hypothetical protein
MHALPILELGGVSHVGGGYDESQHFAKGLPAKIGRTIAKEIPDAMAKPIFEVAELPFQGVVALTIGAHGRVEVVAHGDLVDPLEFGVAFGLAKPPNAIAVPVDAE